MKCPKNTAHCRVLKVGHSTEEFGSPPTPALRYYECAVHGHLTHDVERNSLSFGLPEGANVKNIDWDAKPKR